MIRRFYGNKKRVVAVAAISAVLIVSLIGFLQVGEVAEAAIFDPHPERAHHPDEQVCWDIVGKLDAYCGGDLKR